MILSCIPRENLWIAWTMGSCTWSCDALPIPTRSHHCGCILLVCRVMQTRKTAFLAALTDGPNSLVYYQRLEFWVDSFVSVFLWADASWRAHRVFDTRVYILLHCIQYHKYGCAISPRIVIPVIFSFCTSSSYSTYAVVPLGNQNQNQRSIVVIGFADDVISRSKFSKTSKTCIT